MGSKQSYPGLTDDEVKKLKKHFKVEAGCDRKLSYAEFVNMFKLLNPSVSQCSVEKIALQAFSASDINGDGKLSFEEFLNAYKLTKSTNLCENVKCIMKDYDSCHQNRGCLTQDEAYKYVCYLHKFYGRPKQCNPRNVYQRFNGNNRIGYNEFANYAAKEYEGCKFC